MTDLRAKLERARARVKAYCHPPTSPLARLFRAYAPDGSPNLTFGEADAAFLADLSTLLDQAARVEADRLRAEQLVAESRSCMAAYHLENSQRQLDQDGVEVGVSRNAIAQTLAMMDRLENMLAELSSPASTSPRVGGWLPIESAPRDGTDILVWGPHGHDCMVLAWDEDDEMWMTMDGPSYGSVFTHWQPLPAPPVVSPRVGGGDE